MRERGVPGQLIARELAKVRTKMMTNKSRTAASRTSERQSTMTVNDHVVRYQEHVSTKSYDELVAAFEEAVPDAGPGEPTRTLERVRDGDNSREAWEAAVAPLFGPSGFTRVFSLDTGQLISWYGKPAKAKMYIYGNPIIAASMLVHDIRAAGRVPLQILIYEAENGEVRLGYELPSTIMSRFGNKELDAAALELDKKLVAFATELTGAET